MHITITLKRDRRLPGKLCLVGKDERVIVSGICMGKADDAAAIKAGNPQRAQTLPVGDTPTGTYTGRLLGRVVKPERTYGTAEPIVLDPTGGSALAAKQNGRRGLWIHGGDLTPGGFLRPTYGCVRITPNTHAAVVKFLKQASVKQFAVEVRES